MKKILLLTITICLSSIYFGQVPGYVPTDSQIELKTLVNKDNFTVKYYLNDIYIGIEFDSSYSILIQ